MRLIDLTGMTFGRLTVIQQNGVLANGKNGCVKAWLCRCLCGQLKTVRGKDLTNGNTTSCGCYASESKRARIKHGQYGTHLYKIWADIKKRCHGVGSAQSKRFYKDVTMCEEWESFETFFEWAKPLWTQGLVIDRIDTLQGYSPANCRFVTSKANNQNTKRSKIWIIFGREFNSASDAAQAFNCSTSHIVVMCQGRHYNGKYYPPTEGCTSVKRYQGVA